MVWLAVSISIAVYLWSFWSYWRNIPRDHRVRFVISILLISVLFTAFSIIQYLSVMIWVTVFIIFATVLWSLWSYREDRQLFYRNGLVIATLLAFVLGALFLYIGTFRYNGPPLIPTLVPTSTSVLVIDVPQSSLDIVLDTPTVMQKDTSYTIEVTLEPKGKSLVTDLGLEGASATASGTAAVGTPGATLGDAFGSGFQAPLGKATLSSNTFDIASVGSDEQPLNQPKVVWEWSVTPRSSGVQYLAVTIEAVWTAANGVENGPYRVGDRTFNINVQDSFVHQGNFDIGAVLTSLPAAIVAALFGAGGLGVVFILWLVQRRSKQSKPPDDDDILFADE